jgi:16S rRNA (cytidine1402-2'-O)-methyltransferase
MGRVKNLGRKRDGMSKQKSFVGVEEKGCLYLVATPIGNLEDMTFRAVRILKEVDCIAAEDTRQTRKLLSHFEIANRLISYHEHNKLASGPEIVRMLLEGKRIALVSDAGIPAISDPGQELVQLAAAEGVPVIPIPGANAALSALIVSGLSTERFLFMGFLPKGKKELSVLLQRYSETKATYILYEAPHRLIRTLEQLLEHWGDRRIALVREITKKHEEVFRGTLKEALLDLDLQAPRGEYVIVLEEATESPESQSTQLWWEPLTLEEHVHRYESEGQSKKEAIKQTAVDRGLPKRDVYNEVMKQ